MAGAHDARRGLFSLAWQRWACGLSLLPALIQAAPLLHETPLSHDHPTHLFKAWHFWTEMLGRGRLRGWSHFWGFGFPADELVPSGGELWVALFRALSLGQLSWTRTYALAFAAFLLLKPLCAYLFTRRYYGPTAGLVAAWLTSLDAGAFSEGGWRWNVTWGVWPVSLSLCFALLAIVEWSAIVARGRSRHVLAAGLWMAAALLTHQVALLVFAISAPLFVLDQQLRSRPPPPARLLQLAGALALGCALPATSVVPFLARAHTSMDLGSAREPLTEVARRVVELRTFSHLVPAVHALAWLGALWALIRRKRGSPFILLNAAAFVVASSSVLTELLHLERVFPSVIKIEAPRCLLVAKPFWFALAGYGVARALAALRRQALRIGGARRGWVWAAGLAAGLAAALLACAPLLPKLYAQVRNVIQGEEETPGYADLQRVFAWARELRETRPGHYRIAYDMVQNDHISTLAPIYDGAPMYKIGDTPTQIFDGVPMTAGPEMLRALSVLYVVSRWPLDASLYTEVRSFGQFGIYRFNDYDPNPFELVGPGHAELLEFEPEQVRIRVDGTAPHSRLRVHVAAFDRWQASIGGVELPISTVTVHGVEDPVLMELPARAGELVLRYVYRASDWLGLGLSLLALPAFVLLRRLGHEPWEPLLAQLQRRRRPLGWAALATLAACALAIALRARDASALLPQRSLFYRELDLTLGAQPCTKVAPLRFSCGAQEVRAELVHGRGDHLCMTASPGGPWKATLADRLLIRARLPIGAFLVGRYDAIGVDGSIGAALDGVSLGEARTRPAYMRQQTLQFDTRAHAGGDGALEIDIRGGALTCFDFWWR